MPKFKVIWVGYISKHIEPSYYEANTIYDIYRHRLFYNELTKEKINPFMENYIDDLNMTSERIHELSNMDINKLIWEMKDDELKSLFLHINKFNSTCPHEYRCGLQIVPYEEPEFVKL